MIYIACALHCEAKPLIDFYQLKLDREALYPVFCNDRINLVVAGIGKLEMASAVSYVFAHCGEVKNAAWLNIGIAGHASHPIGSLLNVNKVHDLATGKNYYPGRISGAPGVGCELMSVDIPAAYPESAAADMEASAFLSIVQRYTLVDLLQVIKVVSDNSASDIENIDKAFVTELIKTNMSQIDSLIQILLQQQTMYETVYDSATQEDVFLSTWRFTQYQKKDLLKKLERAGALDLSLSIEVFQACKDSKEVLNNMQRMIDDAVIEF